MFKKTNNMINRLIILTINTGMATLLVTLLTIIFYKAQPNTLNYTFFNILVSPLYCNSVLANLNSRDYVRGVKRVPIQSGGSSDPSAVLELGQLRFNSNSNSDRKTRGSDTLGDNSFGMMSATSSLGKTGMKEQGVRVTTVTHGDDTTSF